MDSSPQPSPGEYIRNELERRGWLQRDLAFMLHVPEQAINMVVAGKRALSADMARLLSVAFDKPPEFLLGLQKNHEISQELAHAKEPDPSVIKMVQWQSRYPIRDMIKRGWLDADSTSTITEEQLADFFKVANVTDPPRLPHAAKKTGSYSDEISGAQFAWLARVAQIAERLIVPDYSEKTLRDKLPKLRSMMRTPEDVSGVPRILHECGIRFVLVEVLPGSKIDGVCFWLKENTSPVVGLSLRFDRIDNFWFVLRHELEHVLRRHGVEKIRIDDNLDVADEAELPPEEKQANAAASDFCVPTAKMDSWIARKAPFFSERELLGFATLQQVHPGIVAGQFRNRTKKYNLFTKYLVKVRNALLSSAVVDGWGAIYPITR